jgi:hypothetical protein
MLKRVKDKLTGRDFKRDEELNYTIQVDRLLIGETKMKNLCQPCVRWCSFWEAWSCRVQLMCRQKIYPLLLNQEFCSSVRHLVGNIWSRWRRVILVQVEEFSRGAYVMTRSRFQH